MSELDFGPSERDYFVYQHMKIVFANRLPGLSILDPPVSLAFAALDQINRCKSKGINEHRIKVGSAIADIDVINQIVMREDAISSEDLHGG